MGLNELSWRTYTPRWLVRRLSTCFSQQADQMSLQINLIASNVSVNNGLSRHNRSAKFAPTCNPIDSNLALTSSSSLPTPPPFADPNPLFDEALPAESLPPPDTEPDVDSRILVNVSGTATGAGMSPASIISCSIFFARADATAEEARRALTASIRK